ncbi:MAG: GDSL family lipase [Clostridiales bacterium]|nr:GDSL family lipase [Clostridiales bacterium]
MKTWKLTEIPELKVLGRNNGEMDPLTLFWHGSGVEFAVRAKEVWMEFYTEYESFEHWISIWVDGALISRHILPKGSSLVPIFLNADPGVIRQVRVLKEVQPMTEDSVNLFQICGVQTDGSFEKIPEKKWKLEFIGDSLTSGEGTIGAVKEMTWNSMVMGASFAYPLLTADALDSECRIMSKGGWGVFCSYDGDPTRNIPQHYEKICSMLDREKEAAWGSKEDNDFAAWQPDAIIVNLGTNDDSAFHSEPMYPDGDTGELLHMKMISEKEYEPASVKRVQDAVIAFLQKLRKNNPEAYILWAYASFDQILSKYIKEAVQMYITQTGDRKAEPVKFPTLTDDLKGSREHPGRVWHQQVVELLSELLPEKLG